MMRTSIKLMAIFSVSQFKDYLEGGARKLIDFSKTFDGKY